MTEEKRGRDARFRRTDRLHVIARILAVDGAGPGREQSHCGQARRIKPLGEQIEDAVGGHAPIPRIVSGMLLALLKLVAE